MAGGELPETAKGRPRVGHVTPGQEVVKRLGVGLGAHARVLKDRLRLRREHERVVVVVVDERLLAQPVTSYEERARPTVPEREREHAAQEAQRIGPVRLVEVQDRLGVAVGSERVATAFQLPPQRLEVVDLAVEHEPQRAVLVAHRLRGPRREVDDAEPPHPEPDRAVDPDALVVRPAMAKGRGHAAKQILSRRGTVEMNRAGDATHGLDVPRRVSLCDHHFVACSWSFGCETRQCHTTAWNASVWGVT